MNMPNIPLRRNASALMLSLPLIATTLTACDNNQPSSTGQSSTGAPNRPADVTGPQSDSLNAKGPLPERQGQIPGGGGAAAVDPKFNTIAVDPNKLPQASSTPPSVPNAAAAPEADPAVAMFAGLTAPKPATWQYRAPSGSSGMRVAEYSVPGANGSDQADIIVYQFPGGGSPQANIDRWKGQFKHADNSPVEAKTQELQADGMAITIAEINGDYRGMGKSEYAPDQMLLAGMIETDGNPVFVQLVGPSKTVEANREAFMAMMRGLKKSEPMK